MRALKKIKKIGIALAAVFSIAYMSGCASRPADESAAEETKVVQTDKGEVEIPAHPQRIVSDYYLGEFLAVDTKPVIASPYALDNPYLADQVEGIEPMNITSAETAQEMIAAAEPDLIVTIIEADYEKYSKIAPTVYIEDGKRSDEQLFRYIAQLVGKEKEADEYLREFHEKVEKTKPEVQQAVGDKTVSIVEVWPQQIYSMGSHFARGGTILYDLWGLKAPETVQKEMVDGDEAYQVVSLEALPDYTGDYILYGVLSDTDPDFVTDSAIWNNLPAVQAKRVLPYRQVAFMHRDPISLNGQLDELYAFLTGKEVQE
ncbi:ABC transporter substrate-binding protein [uncultured Dubosiella sp.]|uniref:ABC transporter substrate-binding protein n=1 Tax=uncultured Dubosiella sp. TaxID=1937011 RepID=UPI002595A4BB|nr:ABC transporter substrate-binding protein [uncultured Dubosiella sp.]